jgi:chaperone required for assembly of F1-ATPase
MTGAPARRFYRSVAVTGAKAPFSIALDDRPLRTPLKRPLDLPTRSVAEVVALEWLSQSERIEPQKMPFTRLANTAVDRVADNYSRIIGDIVDFAGSDLVCYRADEPTDLIERQARNWQPVLDWARARLGGDFVVTEGIVHVEQPASALEAIQSYLAGKDAWALTALHNMTTLTGSALISAMACEAAILPSEAWLAAHIDEDWQIVLWGWDEEARLRRDHRRQEFDVCLRFYELSR